MYALVRYGSIPEVARFSVADFVEPRRNAAVVVQTHRGQELGTFLEQIKVDGTEADGNQVLRTATPDDLTQHENLRGEVENEFNAWCVRIAKWELELQLVDLEWTLDREKLILYVLNDRGADCSKLALQAAGAGLGIIEVQPIDENGPVPLPTAGGGGCGSCGTGGGGCNSEPHEQALHANNSH